LGTLVGHDNHAAVWLSVYYVAYLRLVKKDLPAQLRLTTAFMLAELS